MPSDYVFACERCTPRLARHDIKITCPLDKELVKRIKNEHFEQTGQKLSSKIVLTSCLGECPDNAISYLKTHNKKEVTVHSFPSTSHYEDIKDLLII